MVLPVVPAEPTVAEQSVPTPVDEVAGSFQVWLNAGLPIELNQCGLNLGVSTDAVDLAPVCAECVPYQVRHPPSYLEQTWVGGGPVQRHGRLDQVSGAVQLVSPLQLDEPLAGEPHLEVGVEVAVGLLGVAKQPLGLA